MVAILCGAAGCEAQNSSLDWSEQVAGTTHGASQAAKNGNGVLIEHQVRISANGHDCCLVFRPTAISDLSMVGM